MSALIIQNLDQLADALNYVETGIFTIEEILESAEIQKENLSEDLITWSDSEVTKNTVESNGDYEVSIRGWEPNQEIESSGDYVFVIEGSLTNGTDNISAGSFKQADKGTKLSNGATKSISLHIIE